MCDIHGRAKKRHFLTSLETSDLEVYSVLRCIMHTVCVRMVCVHVRIVFVHVRIVCVHVRIVFMHVSIVYKVLVCK